MSDLESGACGMAGGGWFYACSADVCGGSAECDGCMQERIETIENRIVTDVSSIKSIFKMFYCCHRETSQY